MMLPLALDGFYRPRQEMLPQPFGILPRFAAQGLLKKDIIGNLGAHGRIDPLTTFSKDGEHDIKANHPAFQARPSHRLDDLNFITDVEIPKDNEYHRAEDVAQHTPHCNKADGYHASDGKEDGEDISNLNTHLLQASGNNGNDQQPANTAFDNEKKRLTHQAAFNHTFQTAANEVKTQKTHANNENNSAGLPGQSNNLIHTNLHKFLLFQGVTLLVNDVWFRIVLALSFKHIQHKTSEHPHDKHQKEHERPGQGKMPEQKLDINLLGVLERKNHHQNENDH
jgi:hypothetical protein